MDFASIITDILVVLVAAKLAAEIAERVGIPAVVGEIVAGVLIGPSVFGLVGGHDEVLRTLGELGVILLLLEVGLEMDLVELGKVGRSSMLVATVGVAAPLVLGLGGMTMIGEDFNTSLFVAAALTATSVGITARVFGDLRALATTEARIVLGATVADDVMGLVVLTVVVRLVTEGSVSLLSVLGIILVAVGFLVVVGWLGLRAASPFFSVVERFSRSTGTLVAVAFAFTLLFARLADAAQLTPIVGAFVAGIALSRASQADRIRRELQPVGHLFIPVFFLQIGIDVDVSAFAQVSVLRDAAILFVVAVVGKLLSPIGALGTRGDKVLIGLGMLPRGEVGLIFATIGLQTGVLGDELYASLLLVVLVTTLITPPLLKFRMNRVRAATRRTGPAADTPEPDEGWLAVIDGEIRLRVQPPDEQSGLVGYRAAVLAGRNHPSSELLEWLSTLADLPLEWDEPAREAFLDVIERGNSRSWRFLLSTGLLDRGLPKLAAALRERESEPFSLDATAAYRFGGLERLRALDPDDPVAVVSSRLPELESLLLALLVLEATDSGSHRVKVAEAVAKRLGLDGPLRTRVVGLVDADQLLWAAAHRPGALSENAVLPLVTHLETPERARALYVLTAVRNGESERWELERLRQLHDLIQAVLADPGMSGVESRSLADHWRADAMRLARESTAVEERIQAAPVSYVIRQGSSDLANVCALIEPPPGLREARVAVTELGEGQWKVDVGARDRAGLLAMVTGALAECDLDVLRAVVAIWPDGVAVDSFHLHSDRPPSQPKLVRAVEAALDAPVEGQSIPDAEVRFDDRGSPWHTICEVEAADRPGLLHHLATAFTAAGAEVVSATASSHEDTALDTFELVGADGGKLTPDIQDAVVRFVAEGATLTRRRFGRKLVPTGVRST